MQPSMAGSFRQLTESAAILCGTTEELRVRAGHLTLGVFEGSLLTQVHFEEGLLAYS